MASYTLRSETPMLDILTECSVYQAIPTDKIKSESDLPEAYNVKSALWDTGAEATLINPRVVNALKLQRFSQTQLDGIGGDEIDDTYLVHIKLPTGDFAFNVEATETANTGDYDVVIGMDIIAYGDFAFTNKDFKSVFSFRFPSEEHIEF